MDLINVMDKKEKKNNQMHACSGKFLTKKILKNVVNHNLLPTSGTHL